MPGALKEDGMKIGVTRDGHVFFGSSHIAPADLPNFIRESVGNGAERKIYLAVDARAKYGDVIVILNQIREAGIEDVAFLTEKPYR